MLVDRMLDEKILIINAFLSAIIAKLKILMDKVLFLNRRIRKEIGELIIELLKLHSG